MSDWIEWNGGECPVPDGVEFKFKFRDNRESQIRDTASRFRWRHINNSDDIIAYRILDEKPASDEIDISAKPPAEPDPYTTQVGGDHYSKLAIQPMQYSMANGLDACQHTAIKYITRFRDKGGVADLEKAKHVIDMLIAHEVAK